MNRKSPKLGVAWKMARLFGLQAKHLALMLRAPRESRHFWYRLFQAAKSTDRYLAATIRHHMETVPAERVLPGIGRAAFSLHDYVEEYGGVSLAEACIIAGSVRLLAPRSLFEFGTFRGTTTLQLVANAPLGAEIHTIDLPEGHPSHGELQAAGLVAHRVGERFRGTPLEARIRQHFGDTSTYDFSPFQGSVDWILIDASHSYEMVRTDSRSALKMLRSGGVIFWHDFSPAYDGNCRAIAELARALPIVRLEGTSLAFHRAATPGTTSVAQSTSRQQARPPRT